MIIKYTVVNIKKIFNKDTGNPTQISPRKLREFEEEKDCI